MPKPWVIDCSHHQPDPIDWRAVKASGVVGVIHKVSEGTGYADPSFPKRRRAIKEAGLLLGMYHFASGAEVARQVAWFVSKAAPEPDDLLALDYEDNAASQMSLEQAREFIRLVEQMTTRSCVLYSGNTVKDALKRTVDPYLGQRRLWLAQYSQRPVPQASWASGPWLWQYSDKGTVPGIKGNVDVNEYRRGGDLAKEWSGWKGLKAVPPPAEPVRPPPDVPLPKTPDTAPRPSAGFLSRLLPALFILALTAGGVFVLGKVAGLW